MEIERFAKNSQALDYRIYVNENFAKHDFDKWLFENLDLRPSLKVLDVGCGTGKHLFPISKMIGKEGLAVGSDISEESLSKCRKINESGVKLYNVDLTEMKNKIDMTFDRVLSSFSIYYTKDKIKTFNDIYDLLNEDGILFICGPAKETNKEFFGLVEEAGGKFLNEHFKWSRFLEDDAQPILKKLFGSVEVIIFKNPIEFPTESVLLNYWKSTVLYDKNIEENMKKIIKKKFNNGTFTVTKVIMGLKCRKYRTEEK
ncbi:class I SAM-dependent methyltransferase [Candidatus Woesearchaeota archaeon]|nr:class I SAM-dependent methyltransferase [Candidatus Woesearchaeota archaeon]